MALMIETPQQELQQMLGQLTFDNVVLRHQVEALQRQLEAAISQPDETPDPDGD